jgi:hypothetical protein
MDGIIVQPLSCLSRLIGQRIESIARVCYWHRGVADLADGSLEIKVAGEVVLLDGASDGESLRVRNGPWVDPFDEPVSTENLEYIAEHGRWQRVDCSIHEFYDDFLKEAITDVRLLENEHGRTAGVKISVPARSLWFVVEGDECHVHWGQPVGFSETR